MELPHNKRIAAFIQANKILTLCCIDGDNKPYCFHCFYAFDEENHLLFFKSSPDTHHAKLLLLNPAVAGSILPEKVDILALKGIQLSGTILYDDVPGPADPAAFYHKKFPFAFAKTGRVWCIQIDSIKMTDNTIVFGKKLEWHRNELIPA